MKPILLILLLFSTSAIFCQDTICVERSEMIVFASNAIKVKQLSQEVLLIDSELKQCRLTVGKLNEATEIYDQVHQNDSIIIESQRIELDDCRKKERRFRGWKAFAIGGTAVAIIETIVLLKKPQK